MYELAGRGILPVSSLGVDLLDLVNSIERMLAQESPREQQGKAYWSSCRQSSENREV